jgi:hypothetical protein
VNDQNRYKKSNGTVVIEIAVDNSKQLFNARDPSPFKERDLDEDFVISIVNSVQEFPMPTLMKIKIYISNEFDLEESNQIIIKQAIQSYFRYESRLSVYQLQKRLRSARLFALIGIVILVVCLSLSEYLDSLNSKLSMIRMTSVGLSIIGWVALWHPIEMLLYEWIPIREQRLYFDKIANLDIEILNMDKNLQDTAKNKQLTRR